MEEFLKQHYLLITHSVELLAAVTGLFCLKKYRGTAVIYFIYFLMLVFIGEMISTYPKNFEKWGVFHWIDNTLIESNHWWSALYWKIGATLFYSFYFRKILKSDAYRKLLLWMTYIFVVIVVSAIIITWPDVFSRNLPIISLLGAVLIISCALCYFFETLQGDNILTFYKSINFYISATILIWWLVITPIVFFDVYFSTEDWNFIFLKWQIYMFANVTMYLTFTFALLWCKPKTD